MFGNVIRKVQHTRKVNSRFSQSWKCAPKNWNFFQSLVRVYSPVWYWCISCYRYNSIGDWDLFIHARAHTCRSISFTEPKRVMNKQNGGPDFRGWHAWDGWGEVSYLATICQILPRHFSLAALHKCKTDTYTMQIVSYTIFQQFIKFTVAYCCMRNINVNIFLRLYTDLPTTVDSAVLLQIWSHYSIANHIKIGLSQCTVHEWLNIAGSSWEADSSSAGAQIYYFIETKVQWRV